MKFSYLTNNVSYTEPKIVDPFGVIIYSTPFFANKSQLIALMNDPFYNMSMHAIVDQNGITITLPFNYKGWHSGTTEGNTKYIGIIIPDINEDQKHSVLWNLQEFLAYFVISHNIPIDKIDSFIYSMGKAHESNLVSDSVYKVNSALYHYFAKNYLNKSETADSNFNEILTRVKEIVGQVTTIQDQVINTLSNNDTKVNIKDRGNIALFTGGSLFKTRGASTRLTSNRNLMLAVVSHTAAGSKHPYEVVFQSGEEAWVNKTSITFLIA